MNEAVRLEAGTHHATHSLGICESTGRYSVRQVIGVASDSALVCASSIPEGVAVRWMAATPQDKATATRDAAQIAQAITSAPPAPAAALVVFPSKYGFRFSLPHDRRVSTWAALRDIVGHSTPIAGCGAASASSDHSSRYTRIAQPGVNDLPVWHLKQLCNKSSIAV